MSLGIAWLMRHRGVPNGYSTASSYQVPTSLKYYLTQRVFWQVLALLGLYGVEECQMVILRHLLTKCQLVRNIIGRQRVFWQVLALLGIYGVVECKCLFYGDFLQSAK